MMYTIVYRHCWIHATVERDSETYRVQYPGTMSASTYHTSAHAAKLAVTRDWKLYCLDTPSWKRKHGDVTMNPNIRSCI